MAALTFNVKRLIPPPLLLLKLQFVSCNAHVTDQ
jgi:hypothetical protein